MTDVLIDVAFGVGLLLVGLGLWLFDYRLAIMWFGVVLMVMAAWVAWKR